MHQPRDNSVQSVDRAVSVLQVLARSGDLGLTEIAESVAVHKSTVSRLLGTLEARGLVEQEAHRGRYRLGGGIALLAEGLRRQPDILAISRPVCMTLADAVGETVNVAIAEDGAVVTVDQVMGPSGVTTVNWVGQRSPMHATSAGKVFLAYLPDAEQRLREQAAPERFTAATIVDPARMEDELATVRRRGFAASVDEHEVGLSAVGAPVRQLDGRVVAALVVSGPTFRMDEESIAAIGAQVVRAAADISAKIGFATRP